MNTIDAIFIIFLFIVFIIGIIINGYLAYLFPFSKMKKKQLTKDKKKRYNELVNKKPYEERLRDRPYEVQQPIKLGAKSCDVVGR